MDGLWIVDIDYPQRILPVLLSDTFSLFFLPFCSPISLFVSYLLYKRT